MDTPSIRLPSTVAVGFTGHRTIPQESKVRRLVFDYLARRKSTIEGLVYGVSSAAAGGDLLFAETCIELSIPLQIILPFEQEQFRRDFDDPTWVRVQHVLQKALSIEIITGNLSRDESYYECGIQTVQKSEILIAIWDGEPSKGRGGTQEIVHFAKNTGRPVVWFHALTGDVRVFNEAAEQVVIHDAELDFLNQLPDFNVTQESSSPRSTALAWFRKIDQSATRLAPHVHRLASIPIVCTAAAAIFSGAGSWGPQTEPLVAIGGALGIIAAALPAVLRIGKRQALWARTRTAAEVCRSVLAFWYAPARYEAVGPEVIPELSGMLASLNLLRMLDDSRKAVDVDEFKARYRQERMSGQITYYSTHASRSAKAGLRFRLTAWISTGGAILISVGLFLSNLESRGAHAIGGKKWAALAASVLFQVATVAGALFVVNDCERRQERYEQVHRRLRESDSELEALATWPSVLRVVNRVERALLVELLEWRSLVRHTKLPRK